MKLVRKSYKRIIDREEFEEFAAAMGSVLHDIDEARAAKDAEEENLSPTAGDCGGKDNQLLTFSSVESELFDMDDVCPPSSVILRVLSGVRQEEAATAVERANEQLRMRQAEAEAAGGAREPVIGTKSHSCELE